MDNRKYILTIAGHDPSAGAGITSDIKTFEAHGLYGLSVCTAVTVQNDVAFKDCLWLHSDIILYQIETLFERFEIGSVKIGLVESWATLLLILEKLHTLNSVIKIVLDPIIKASAGFDFHSTENQNLLDYILAHCYIITPNYDEIKYLYPVKNIEETLKHMSKITNIYLKGGHRTDKKGWDALYKKNNFTISFPPNTTNISEKHGSGCVLASALASHIALGSALETACKHSKHYTEQFLNSNPSFLGTHHQI